MNFWGSLGNAVKEVGRKVMDTAKEAKEIQQNKMTYLSDADLLNETTRSSFANQLAAKKEAKDRGIWEYKTR